MISETWRDLKGPARTGGRGICVTHRPRPVTSYGYRSCRDQPLLPAQRKTPGTIDIVPGARGHIRCPAQDAGGRLFFAIILHADHRTLDLFLLGLDLRDLDVRLRG